MSYETLTLTVENNIGILSINRPKALNALNAQVLTELIQCFHEVHKNSDIKAVIITGAGDKAFVAGADIAAMQGMSALDAAAFGEVGHRAMKVIENSAVPVVAAVNGFCLGGGLELALSCDFIYASTAAKMGLPEVNLGLFPGFGGTQRLARLIGRARAKELVYTAKIIGAQEAFDLGIVNKLCEPEKLLDEVKAVLGVILSKGQVAVRLAKKVMNEGTDLPLMSGLKLEEMTFPLTFASEDKKEGVAAFLEKRPAKFTGK